MTYDHHSRLYNCVSCNVRILGKELVETLGELFPEVTLDLISDILNGCRSGVESCFDDSIPKTLPSSSIVEDLLLDAQIHAALNTIESYHESPLSQDSIHEIAAGHGVLAMKNMEKEIMEKTDFFQNTESVLKMAMGTGALSFLIGVGILPITLTTIYSVKKAFLIAGILGGTIGVGTLLYSLEESGEKAVLDSLEDFNGPAHAGTTALYHTKYTFSQRTKALFSCFRKAPRIKEDPVNYNNAYTESYDVDDYYFTQNPHLC